MAQFFSASHVLFKKKHTTLQNHDILDSKLLMLFSFLLHQLLACYIYYIYA